MPFLEPDSRPLRSLNRPPRWPWLLAASMGMLLVLTVLLRPELGVISQSLSNLYARVHQDSGQASYINLLTVLGPSLIALLIAIAVAALPRRGWSVLLTLLLLSAGVVRYLVWRCGTLDQRSTLGFTAGALMLTVEILYIVIQGLALVPAPLFDPWRRRRQADQLQSWSQEHPPSVEIWLRSSREDERLIRRALIAARAIDYPGAVQVSLLDSVGRESLRRLAESTGARYVQACQAAELSNAGGEDLAPAALATGSSELVAVFEGGSMPYANFLTRTTGFFSDARVAMVQTPLSHFRSEFYNRNLGADQVMPSDRDIFFHYGEVVLDRFNSVQVCEGSYLIRRSELLAMVSSKSCTSGWLSRGAAAIQRQGKKIIYLDEILSVGEAPRTFAAFLLQQIDHRYRQLQIAAAGGTAPRGRRFPPIPTGYRLSQVLDQLTPLLRIAFFLLPMGALLLGIPLIEAQLSDYLIYGLPLIILFNVLPNWLTDHHYSRFWKEVSETLVAITSLETLIGSILYGQKRSFPKETETETVHDQTLNINLAWPFVLGLSELITILILRYILPIIPGFEPLMNPGYTGETLMLLWNLHNGWLMIVCLICAIDQPTRRQGDRVPIQCTGSLQLGEFRGGGITCDLSETGAAFLLNPGLAAPQQNGGWLLLEDLDLRLPVDVVRFGSQGDRVRVALRYGLLDAATTGQLLKLLYGGGVDLPKARRINALAAFASLLGGMWGANPIVRRY